MCNNLKNKSANTKIFTKLIHLNKHFKSIIIIIIVLNVKILILLDNMNTNQQTNKCL